MKKWRNFTKLVEGITAALEADKNSETVDEVLRI
jgi:hypothetical protein